MTVQLNSQAAALLKQMQVRNDAPLDPAIEQALTKQAEKAGGPDVVLTAKQVEEVLLAAMPDKKSVIADCCNFVKDYSCDNHNAQFLTQILDTRVEKDFAVVQTSRPPPPRVFRDPYHADIQMDPRADFIMLFNARDVDAKGQPLLMKIVARERADLSKIDLSNYRTLEDHDSVDKFDVMKVKNNADFIQMKDTDEVEFQFGDPLLAISLNNNAKELSATVKVDPDNVRNEQSFRARNVGGQLVPDENRPVGGVRTTRGDDLDQTPVSTFSERIRLEAVVKDGAPDGAWLDTPNMGQHMDVKMHVDPGYMFEPGANARISLLGSNIDLKIPDDDAQLLGTQAQSVDITVNSRFTMRQVLQQNINERSNSAPTGNRDQASTNTQAWQVIFDEPEKLTVAGHPLKPLRDIRITQDGFADAKVSAVKVPRQGDADHDGQTVKLTLEKGFLTATANKDIEGWKVVAGFTDSDGTWKQSEATLRNKKQSEELEFSFDLDDAPAIHQQDKNLEIRLLNDDGIPAERVNIPFREIGWDL
jgi:hypothetical protein